MSISTRTVIWGLPKFDVSEIASKTIKKKSNRDLGSRVQLASGKHHKVNKIAVKLDDHQIIDVVYTAKSETVSQKPKKKNRYQPPPVEPPKPPKVIKTIQADNTGYPPFVMPEIRAPELNFLGYLSPDVTKNTNLHGILGSYGKPGDFYLDFEGNIIMRRSDMWRRKPEV